MSTSINIIKVTVSITLLMILRMKHGIILILYFFRHIHDLFSGTSPVTLETS